MKKESVFSLAVVLSLSLVSLVFCENIPAAVSEEGVVVQPAVSEAVPAETAGNDVSWVWGEVKAVDATASAFTINYMDYQTDEEKDLVLTNDAETKFDNIGSLADIKVGDTVSVDYAVKDGKNIVKNISVEKMEELPEALSADALAGIEEQAPIAPQAAEPAVATVEASTSEVKAE